LVKRHSTNVIKVILLAYKLGAFHFEIYWTIKSTFGFGSLFYNPINIIVCVGVMDLGVIYLRLQTCWNDFISILNMLILPLIWIFAPCYWDEICGVTWWTIEGSFRTPYFLGIWFWTFIFTQCVASMLGAFTSSIITCCTCCPLTPIQSQL